MPQTIQTQATNLLSGIPYGTLIDAPMCAAVDAHGAMEIVNQHRQKLFSRLCQNIGHASIWILVLAGAIMWGPAAVLGATILSDGTFAPADWTIVKPISPSSPTANCNASQSIAPAFGDPEPSQVTVHTYPEPGEIYCAHVYTNSAGVIDPSKTPVGSLSYSYDLLQINPPASQAVGYLPLVLQNGAYYAGPEDAIYPQSWTLFTHSNLVNTQFTLISGPPGVPPNPNFSCTGPTFQVGFFSANSDPITATQMLTRTSAIDNWSVSVNPPTNPPPPLQPSFTVAVSDAPLGSTDYTITATQAVLPPGVSYGWYVSEVTATGTAVSGTTVNNSATWWTGATTSFPGYPLSNVSTPAIFKQGHFYQITLGWWNSCNNSWAQTTTTVYVGPTP